MQISREEKKQEAIQRMQKLRIFSGTIQQFEDDGYISISEPPFGAFYWADDEDLQRIRAFEAENDALVYLVVRSFTSIGQMDSYLYVSDYAEEWPTDNEDLKNDEPLVYVFNHDMPDCSEFGCIGIEHTAAAGLVRKW